MMINLITCSMPCCTTIRRMILLHVASSTVPIRRLPKPGLKSLSVALLPGASLSALSMLRSLTSQARYRVRGDYNRNCNRDVRRHLDDVATRDGTSSSWDGWMIYSFCRAR
jgi:hypothetical protein